MSPRAEISRKYARGYAKASKRQKGVMLDEVVAATVTGRLQQSALPVAQWPACRKRIDLQSLPYAGSGAVVCEPRISN